MYLFIAILVPVSILGTILLATWLDSIREKNEKGE